MIKSFTVGVKHHVNLGNYESMEVEAQVTLDVEALDVVGARVEAQELLATLLNESFEAQRRPAWFAGIPAKRARVG